MYQGGDDGYKELKDRALSSYDFLIFNFFLFFDFYFIFYIFIFFKNKNIKNKYPIYLFISYLSLSSLSHDDDHLPACIGCFHLRVPALFDVP